MHQPGAVGSQVTFIGSIVSMLVVRIRSKMQIFIYEAQGWELFVDATQCARMPVLLVKPCSTGTHWRCLIVKILLGEGLEIFRFFSCPEDVYYTLAWNEAGCPNFPSSNFVFPEEDYCPQIIFRCLMYLHHNLHPVRHINSFIFRHFYHLCL